MIDSSHGLLKLRFVAESALGLEKGPGSARLQAQQPQSTPSPRPNQGRKRTGVVQALISRCVCVGPAEVRGRLEGRPQDPDSLSPTLIIPWQVRIF